MSVTKSDKSITDRLLKLEYNDERRESHYRELKKDIQVMTDNQRQMTELLEGTHLNGNKGFVKLMELVEQKVEIMESKILLLEKDSDNTKFWGKFIVAVVTIFLGILFKIGLGGKD